MRPNSIEWHRVRPNSKQTKRRSPTEKERIRSTLYNLTFDIRALQQEIQDLMRLRALLYSRESYKRRECSRVDRFEGRIIRNSTAIPTEHEWELKDGVWRHEI